MNNANMPATSNDSTASPNEPELVTFSASELEALRRAGFSQTDWARVDAMRDDAIDYTDAPELTEEDVANAIPTWGHHRIIVQLDPDIFRFVVRQGKNHVRIINEALRAYMAQAAQGGPPQKDLPERHKPEETRRHIDLED